MDLDPEFTDATGKKSIPRPRRRLRWVIYSLLALAGCHFLLTGSPIPLWHIERLNHPVAVRSIGEDSLALQDGRQIRLPFIKKLPKADPCFTRAVTHGVEIADGGEVFGLIDPIRMCGNDPNIFYRVRINLSDLAGSLDPDGIDDAVVHPELIKEFKENSYSRTRDRRGMPFDVSSMASKLRRDVFRASAAAAKNEPVVTLRFSLD
jgi:hypothetical protein